MGIVLQGKLFPDNSQFTTLFWDFGNIALPYFGTVGHTTLACFGTKRHIVDGGIIGLFIMICVCHFNIRLHGLGSCRSLFWVLCHFTGVLDWFEVDISARPGSS